MLRSAAAQATCELCREVSYGGHHAAPAAGLPSGYPRLVEREHFIDVLVGLGALLPGYLLLVPNEHVTSTGELPTERFRTFWRMARRHRLTVEEEFGVQVVTVEHGSSGPTTTPGRACIDHAHVHLLPIPTWVDPTDFVPQDARLLADPLELRDLANRKRNYYLCRLPGRGGSYVASPSANITSQHARRVWARVLGRGGTWDWATFPGIDNMITTIERLRSREARRMVPSSEVEHDAANAETVSAYNAHAESYASLTRDFPDDSQLPRELDRFARETGSSILDAGAGACRDSTYLAGWGKRVVALDAAEKLLATAPDAGGVHKVVGDIRRLPLPEASVDAVWCSAVLMHLDAASVRRALGELARVVRSGGHIQLSVKEGTGSGAFAFDGGAHRRHFFFYGRSELSRLVRSAGFSLLRQWTTRGTDSSDTVSGWLKMSARRD